MVARTSSIVAGVGMCVLLLAGCTGSVTPTTPPRGPSVSATSGSPASTEASPSASPVSDAPPSSSPVPGASPASPPDGTNVATGLNAPWSVVFREGVPLVSERDSGRILQLGEDSQAREVGVIDDVAARGEGGLLGLAVDDRGRLYAYLTTADDNRILRFDVAGPADALTLGRPTTILQGLNKSTTHNGGRIALGPDGMLYAGVGDAGVPGRAQDTASLSGKILRMTPDGGVPPGNPFAESLVWSWGHRNVQGMAWADDGTMFATEFGQNTWDELNIIEPGSNYGWPVVEGIAGNADFVDPVQQWAPAQASPSGMSHLGGTLYIANLRGERLRTVLVSDPSTAREFFSGTHGRLRDVVPAPDGSLWVVTNNTDGRGRPQPGDDRILALSPEALDG